ncbi:MAG: hypothetical protein EZS28_010535 [Streblomastix strix]|uniref:Uncharacterized protein n=1 Tax=Streblomastix strix TaxID=222440 RepID=A0A5J4WHA1_9EUKA|nr:MAG: hypothetical protein EZS28_010535 [Streblomastix strix]
MKGRGYLRGRMYKRNRGRGIHSRNIRVVETYYNDRNIFTVVSYPSVEPNPVTASNTATLDLTQRQIGIPAPQIVETPESWRTHKTPSLKYQLKYPAPNQASSIQAQLITQQ